MPYATCHGFESLCARRISATDDGLDCPEGHVKFVRTRVAPLANGRDAWHAWRRRERCVSDAKNVLGHESQGAERRRLRPSLPRSEPTHQLRCPGTGNQTCPARIFIARYFVVILTQDLHLGISEIEMTNFVHSFLFHFRKRLVIKSFPRCAPPSVSTSCRIGSMLTQ